jgi:hypothetical protein
MKMKPFFIALAFIGLFNANALMAQTQPPPYKLPDNFHFDYETIQVLSGKKNTADSSVIHFFYTKSGDYAGAEISRNSNLKGNLFLVLTRDGMSIIFDEHNKSVTIISVRKLTADLASLTKWIRMDSVIANMRKKMDGRDFQSVKTGNSKQIGNYTSEEYVVTDSRGQKGSVWCTRVDFDTQGDYLIGAVGGNLLKMMSTRMASHPLFQALTQPKTLVTGIDLKDSAGAHPIDMRTISIDQVTKTVSTSGYAVNDYGNMTLPEIFQSEMKKRNH